MTTNMDGIEFRAERERWGYRVCRAGKTYKRFVWRTKAEAEKALRKFLVDLDERPRIPRNSFVSVVGEYLVQSALKGRSQWRLDALQLNFKKFIVPFFGDHTAVGDITRKQVEAFILDQKKRGVTNSTVWHFVTDLRACLNWAVREGVLLANPCNGADLSAIKNRRVNKPPLEPHVVDRAAMSIDNPGDRAWFEVTRFTGMRKDEANRLTWDDISFELGMIRYPGTKTEESNVWLPLAPVAVEVLRGLKAIGDGNPLVFPGRSSQTKGKKIYSRRRMFERIQRVTALAAYKRSHPTMSDVEILEACKKEKFQGGIKLIPKDLRDYFASEISARVNDPAVVMKLLRHTSLTTTTKYLRVVNDRLEAAVQTLGADSGGVLGAFWGRIKAKNGVPPRIPQVAKNSVSIGILGGKDGGGGQSRTADAADMSRVL